MNDVTGEVRYVANYCRDRMCLRCGASRSANVTRALVAEAGDQTVRFATFTLRHSETQLKDQIDRLFRSFSTLRRRPWWKKWCTGGAAILEVKIGRDRLWHVHLHCLLLGQWIDHRELSREWHSVTGDSYVVDLRSIDSGKKAIRYCAGYIGKPVDAAVYESPDKLDEVCRALHGRRVITTWGAWHRLDLDAAQPPVGHWIRVGRISDLVRDAREGDTAAKMMLYVLSRIAPTEHDPP